MDLPIRMPNPSPTLDKNLASMGPGILSSIGVGVWRKAPEAFPDSSLQHYTGYVSVCDFVPLEKLLTSSGGSVSNRLGEGYSSMHNRQYAVALLP